MAWHSDSFLYRYKVTLNADSAYFDSTLTSFHAKITIPANQSAVIAANTRSDNNDIAFTQSDEITNLPHEVVVGSATGYVFYIKLPTVVPDDDLVLYLYFNQADASASYENHTSLWANHHAAVHFESELDSTYARNSSCSNADPYGPGNPAWAWMSPSNSGTVETTDANLGTARTFDGSDDYNFMDARIGEEQASCYFSAWVKFSDVSAGAWQRVFDKAYGVNDQHVYAMGSVYNGVGEEFWRFRLKTGSPTINSTTTLIANESSPLENDLWYLVTFVYDSNTMYIYQNGEQIASTTVDEPGTIVVNGNDNFLLGASPATDQYGLYADMADFRAAHEAMSLDEHKATYHVEIGDTNLVSSVDTFAIDDIGTPSPAIEPTAIATGYSIPTDHKCVPNGVLGAALASGVSFPTNTAISTSAGTGGEMRTWVTRNGITWTFSESHLCGQFVTGDWWVVGPVNITHINPMPSGQASSNPYGLWDGGGNLVAQRWYRNVSKINPSTSWGEGYDSSTAYGTPYYGGNPRLWYNHGKNAAYHNSTAGSEGTRFTDVNPIALQAGDSLCSSVSSPTEAIGVGQTREIEILTCLSTAPSLDAFRPGYGSGTKTVYQESQVDYTVLPNLPWPDRTLMTGGSVSEPTPAIVRSSTRSFANADVSLYPFICEYTCAYQQRYVFPTINQAWGYGARINEVWSNYSAFCTLNNPVSEKKPFANYIIQAGIDLLSLFEDDTNELISWCSAGNGGMYKFPLAFARTMLDSTDFDPVFLHNTFGEDLSCLWVDNAGGVHSSNSVYTSWGWNEAMVQANFSAAYFTNAFTIDWYGWPGYPDSNQFHQTYDNTLHYVSGKGIAEWAYMPLTLPAGSGIGAVAPTWNNSNVIEGWGGGQYGNVYRRIFPPPYMGLAYAAKAMGPGMSDLFDLVGAKAAYITRFLAIERALYGTSYGGFAADPDAWNFGGGRCTCANYVEILCDHYLEDGHLETFDSNFLPDSISSGTTIHDVGSVYDRLILPTALATGYSIPDGDADTIAAIEQQYIFPDLYENVADPVLGTAEYPMVKTYSAIGPTAIASGETFYDVSPVTYAIGCQPNWFVPSSWIPKHTVTTSHIIEPIVSSLGFSPIKGAIVETTSPYRDADSTIAFAGRARLRVRTPFGEISRASEIYWYLKEIMKLLR